MKRKVINRYIRIYGEEVWFNRCMKQLDIAIQNNVEVFRRMKNK